MHRGGSSKNLKADNQQLTVAQILQRGGSSSNLMKKQSLNNQIISVVGSDSEFSFSSSLDRQILNEQEAFPDENYSPKNRKKESTLANPSVVQQWQQGSFRS